MGAQQNITEENLDFFGHQDLDLSLSPLKNSLGFNFDDEYEDKFKASKEAIKAQLRVFHCVISTSFGKDSSTLTVLVLEALRELVEEGVNIPKAYFITVDTLLENPEIHGYVNGEVAKLQNYISKHNLPAEVHVARPSMADNYFVNVIGGRILISTPDQGSRKCTSMMKVNPINRLKRKIAKSHGYKGKDLKDKFISMTGMRYDESVVRSRKMEERNDRADVPTKIFKGKAKKANDYEWMMSPIAYWSLDDVYMCAGECTSNLRTTYSNLEKMIEIYRSSNGGECLINLQQKGGTSGKTSCGARHGCWTCHAVGEDKSMANMIANEEKYAYMKPLNHLRNLMLAYHYDMSKRNFIARSINDDGTVRIAPHSYHAEYCKDLLRWILTIQIKEEEESWAKEILPRFRIFERDDVLAIEYLWNRYGYTDGFAACKIWKDIYQDGMRFDMPDIPKTYNKRLPEYPKYDVPFADEFFGDISSGSLDLDYAITGMDSIDTIETADVFTIDEESAGYLFEYELEYCIERFSGRNYNPTAVVHYLIRFGALKIGKGKQHMLDKTLRMANQLWRHKIKDCLNDPNELIRRLSAKGKTLPSMGQQFDIEDSLINSDVQLFPVNKSSNIIEVVNL